MKIQNDNIIIEPTDIAGLSTDAKSALAAAAKQRTLFVQIPKGVTEAADYLSAVLNDVLKTAKRIEISSEVKEISKALLSADATKRSQAESLIDQAKAVLGV